MNLAANRPRGAFSPEATADIDRITAVLVDVLDGEPGFEGIDEHLRAFAEACKRVSETMRADASHFEVWPQYVATSEVLTEFRPALPAGVSDARADRAEDGRPVLDSPSLPRRGREPAGFVRVAEDDAVLVRESGSLVVGESARIGLAAHHVRGPELLGALLATPAGAARDRVEARRVGSQREGAVVVELDDAGLAIGGRDHGGGRCRAESW